MQSAIEHQVNQTIAAALLPKRVTKYAPTPIYARPHVLAKGPQVLSLMQEGLTGAQIAAKMGIAQSSVRAYATQYQRAVREGMA